MRLLLIAALLATVPGAPALAGQVAATASSAHPQASPAVSVKTATLGTGTSVLPTQLAIPNLQTGVSLPTAANAAVTATLVPVPSMAAAAQTAAKAAATPMQGLTEAAKALSSEPQAQGGQESSAAEQNATGQRVFDGSLRVILTAHGEEPIEGRLEDLPALLAARPQYAAALNKNGRVRVALAKGSAGLSKADMPAIEAALRGYNVLAPVSAETVALQKTEKALEAAAKTRVDAPKTWIPWLAHVATAPLREAAFLARSLSASMTKPTTGEVVGGVVSKGPAFVLSLMWWAKLFLPAHPMAFGAALAGSLALQVFHGVWINSWQNFQKVLGHQRGINYQAAFNFLYMQATTIFFRTVTWLVIPATVMPWSGAYWRDIGVSNILGTFFGVLGFYGLNTLYDKGRISRGARSWLQQGRDLFFLVAGTFLFSGSMHAFWILFVVQQSIDLGLYVISRRAAARPAVYVAEDAVAKSETFKSLYPVTPGPQPSPLKQAVGAVLGNPFVKPLIAAGKWLWRKVRK